VTSYDLPALEQAIDQTQQHWAQLGQGGAQ